MKPLTKHDFAERVWGPLATEFEKNDPKRCRQWAAYLVGKFPGQPIMDAAEAIAMTGRFFPRLSELLDRAGLVMDTPETAAQRAFETCLQISRSGSRDVSALDERTRGVLGGVGGLRRFSETDAADLGYLRAEWGKAFDAHIRGERSGNLLPAQKKVRHQIAAGNAPRQISPPADYDAKKTEDEREIARTAKQRWAELLGTLGANGEDPEKERARDRSIRREIRGDTTPPAPGWADEQKAQLAAWKREALA